MVSPLFSSNNSQFDAKFRYYIGIRAVYQPFYRQIEEIAEKEKKEYF